MNIKDFSKTKLHELALSYANNKFNKYLDNKISNNIYNDNYNQEELSRFIAFYGLALKDINDIISLRKSQIIFFKQFYNFKFKFFTIKICFPHNTYFLSY